MQKVIPRSEIKIEDRTICFYCDKTDLDVNEKFCIHCGFPQNGTDQEMRRYIGQKRIEKIDGVYAEKSVNKFKYYLFIIAFLAFISMLASPDPLTLIIYLILTIAFSILGIWGMNNPFPAMLIGLCIYGALIIGDAIMDPMTILQGIFWKVLIISGLVYGLIACKEYENAKKK